MSRLILIALLATTAISCAAAECDLGFFCDPIKGKRETLPSSQENYSDEDMQIYRPKPLNLHHTRNKAMARFLANAYDFLEKENDY